MAFQELLVFGLLRGIPRSTRTFEYRGYVFVQCARSVSVGGHYARVITRWSTWHASARNYYYGGELVALLRAPISCVSCCIARFKGSLAPAYYVLVGARRIHLLIFFNEMAVDESPLNEYRSVCVRRSRIMVLYVRGRAGFLDSDSFSLCVLIFFSLGFCIRLQCYIPFSRIRSRLPKWISRLFSVHLEIGGLPFCGQVRVLTLYLNVRPLFRRRLSTRVLMSQAG